jgi:hypothetical protein
VSDDLGDPRRSLGPFLPADLDLLDGYVGIDGYDTPVSFLPGPGPEPFDLMAIDVEVDGAWTDPDLLGLTPDRPVEAPLDVVRVGGDGAISEVVLRLWPRVVADEALPLGADGMLDVPTALGVLEGRSVGILSRTRPLWLQYGAWPRDRSRAGPAPAGEWHGLGRSDGGVRA